MRQLYSCQSQLQQEVEQWATLQGMNLDQFVDQFVVWAVMEKVRALKQQIIDLAFSEIVIRQGAGGVFFPVLRGTSIRVQTLVVASQEWGLSTSEIASQYDLTDAQVNEALVFYAAHRSEMDDAIAAEQNLESAHA